MVSVVFNLSLIHLSLTEYWHPDGNPSYWGNARDKLAEEATPLKTSVQTSTTFVKSKSAKQGSFE